MSETATFEATAEVATGDSSLEPDAPKPKFKFLKRGEGTQKRLQAYKLRKSEPLTESVSAKVDLAAQADDSTQAGSADGRPPRKGPQARVLPVSAERLRHQAPNGRKNSTNERPAPTKTAAFAETAVDLSSGGHDAELEEFKRLEKQIRREMGESVASLPDVPAETQQVDDRCVMLDSSHPNSYVQSMLFKRSSAQQQYQPQQSPELAADHLGVAQQPPYARQGYAQLAFAEAAATQHSLPPQQAYSRQQQAPATRGARPATQSSPHKQGSYGQPQPLANGFHAAAPLDAPQHVTYTVPPSWPGPEALPASMAAPPGAVLGQRLQPVLEHHGAAQVDGRVAALEQEMERLKFERDTVSALRQEMERASQALEREREAFLQHKEQTKTAADAERDRELASLRREKAALEKQTKALLSQAIPSRKERAEIEAMEAVVAATQKESKAKDARHKLTVERLRRQIVTLQEQSSQMREELEWHEKALEQSRSEAKKKPKKGKGQSVGVQTDAATLLPLYSAAAARFDGQAPPAAIEQSACANGVFQPRHPASNAAATSSRASERLSQGEPDVAYSSFNSGDGQRAGRTGVLVERHTAARAVDLSRGVFHPLAVDASGVALGLPVYPPGSAPLTENGPLQPGMAPPAYGLAQPRPARPATANAQLRPTLPPPSASAPEGAPPPTAAAWGGRAVSAERKNITWGSEACSSDSEPAGLRQQRAPARDSHDREDRGSKPAWGARPRPADDADQSCDSSDDRRDADRGEPAAAPAERAPVRQRAQEETGWADDEEDDGTRGKDENVSADFNAGQLAEIAAIQAELSASRSQMSDRTWKADKRPTASCITASTADNEADSMLRPHLHGASAQRASFNPDGNVWAAQSTRASFAQRVDTEREYGLPAAPAAERSAHGRLHTAPAASWQPMGAPPLHQPQQTALRQTADARQLLQRAGGAATGCVRSAEHGDGKVERWYEDGRREVCFANGTVKHVLPSGLTMVKFMNGDIKKTLTCGTVEYFYKEVDTWHTTAPSGVEVFYFPNGQTEAHHLDGSKEIIFPDGILRCVLPNGEERDLAASALSQAVLSTKPQALMLD